MDSKRQEAIEAARAMGQRLMAQVGKCPIVEAAKAEREEERERLACLERLLPRSEMNNLLLRNIGCPSPTPEDKRLLGVSNEICRIKRKWNREEMEKLKYGDEYWNVMRARSKRRAEKERYDAIKFQWDVGTIIAASDNSHLRLLKEVFPSIDTDAALARTTSIEKHEFCEERPFEQRWNEIHALPDQHQEWIDDGIVLWRDSQARVWKWTFEEKFSWHRIFEHTRWTVGYFNVAAHMHTVNTLRAELKLGALCFCLTSGDTAIAEYARNEVMLHHRTQLGEVREWLLSTAKPIHEELVVSILSNHSGLKHRDGAARGANGPPQQVDGELPDRRTPQTQRGSHSKPHEAEDRSDAYRGYHSTFRTSDGRFASNSLEDGYGDEDHA